MTLSFFQEAKYVPANDAPTIEAKRDAWLDFDVTASMWNPSAPREHKASETRNLVVLVGRLIEETAAEADRVRLTAEMLGGRTEVYLPESPALKGTGEDTARAILSLFDQKADSLGAQSQAAFWRAMYAALRVEIARDEPGLAPEAHGLESVPTNGDEPKPDAVAHTERLLRSTVPALVDVMQHAEVNDDGRTYMVIEVALDSSANEIAHAYQLFVRRWATDMPPNERRHIRVLFSASRALSGKLA